MKKYYLSGLCIMILLLCNGVVQAQLVGDCLFLQGKYLECSVAPNGAWGNTVAPPAGYHTHSGGSTYYTDPVTGTAYGGTSDIDFSYDANHDGWGTGTIPADPYWGPYFLPGTPFDGWSVQVNGKLGQAFYTTTGFGTLGGAVFGGTNTSYATSLSTGGCITPNTKIGYWTGYFIPEGTDTLSIVAQNRIDTLASWDVVTIKFVNKSATTMTGLYYFATGDPDNDEPCSTGDGSFPTNNHIMYQNDARHRVMVESRPPTLHQDAYSSLCTRDCRAKAMIYVSWPPSLSATNDLDLVYAGTATGMSTLYYGVGNTTYDQDIAMGLIYNLGSLAPHDSTILSFAWNFKDSTCTDSAFPDPVLVVNGVKVGQPDTIPACSGIVPVCLANASDKDWSWATWTWSPSVGLSSTIGVINNVNTSAITAVTTYTITGTDSISGMHSCNSYVLYLTVLPCFAAVNNGPLCFGDTLRLDAVGDSTGATYQWYGPGGVFAGTAHHTVIYPATYADSGTWFVIRTVAGANDTAWTHVIIHWKPTLTLSSNAPLCYGMVDTLTLNAIPDSAGETFSWTGPAGYVSTLPNPTRTGYNAADTGFYTVVATSMFGCKDTAKIDAGITAQPPTPVLTGVTHYCTGETFVPFTVTGYTGTLMWYTVGAGGVGSTTAPVINTSYGATYTYWVSQTIGTCVSLRDSITVTVVVTPPPPPITGTSVYCQYVTYVPPTATGTGILWYTVPTGGIGSATVPVINTSIPGVTTIYATQTDSGCTSPRSSFTITVNPVPLPPVITGVTVYCQNDVPVPFTVTGVTGTLLWYTSAVGGVGSTTPTPINTTTPGVTTYWVSQTNGSCESNRASITVSVHPTPVPPVITGATSYCQYVTFTGVSATPAGTGVIEWYTSIGGIGSFTPPVINTAIPGTYTIYATQTDSGCVSPLDSIVITVHPLPAPPVLTGITVYCQNEPAVPFTVLGVTGTLYWYTAATGGVGSTTPTPINTATPGVTTYWVSQSNGFCESPRASITVIVHPTPATPVITGTSTYCQYDAFIPLTATATGTGVIHWYTTIGGGSSPTCPIINTAIPGTYTIYATQTDSGCTSPIDSFIITIGTMPGMPVVSGPTVYCLNQPFVPFTVGGVVGTVLWYTTATGGVGSTTAGVVNTAVVGITSFWVSQKIGSCESPRDSIRVAVHPNPPMPILTGPTTYCQYDSFIYPTTFTTGTGVIQWYTSPSGAPSLFEPPVTTLVPGVTTIYATQIDSGCISPMDSIVITVNAKPLQPLITDTPGQYCPGQTWVPFTILSGTGLLWYTTVTGGVGSATTPTVNTAIPGTTNFWVTQTVTGCTSDRWPVSILVYDSVISSFTDMVKLGCSGDTVRFNNTSAGANSYEWNFGDGAIVDMTNPTHIYMSQGSFVVTLFAHSMYCLDSSKQTIVLNHPLSAAFTMMPSDTVCQNTPVSFVSTVGSEIPPAYLWQFGDGLTSTVTEPTHTFPRMGVYSVTLTVTDFVPCSVSVTRIITVDSLSPIKLDVTDTVLCQGTFSTFTSLYEYLGSEGLVWYMGDGTDSLKNRNPLSYSFNYPDSFTITAVATFRACPEEFASRKIYVLPQPQLNLGADTSICPGSDAILLCDRTNNNNPLATWKWSTGQTGSSIYVGAPGVYTAIVDLSGCYTTDSVIVSSDCYMDIPNVFSPNNDGINDYFYPRQLLSKGLTYCKINIFNRWGELIFESTATDGRGWDGRFNGVEQPEGVYIYMIDAGFKDGRKEHHQGNITLMR